LDVVTLPKTNTELSILIQLDIQSSDLMNLEKIGNGAM